MSLESIAVDGAKSAISIVLSKAWDGIRLLWDFRSDLDKLKNRLEVMEALLDERQPIKKVELKWFDKVKKAAYEADDLLDEILYEHLRSKQEIKRSFTSISNPLWFRGRMAGEVRKVLALIDEVFNEAKEYGIQRNKGKKVLSALDRELQQCRELPDARQFIGRKSDEVGLVESLCSSFSPSEDLPVVAIVGIGGIGKTILAKRVYENETIKNTFFKRIWICVSDDFDIKKILGQMIEQLTESKPDLTSIVAHTNKLRGLMEGAKYLLVLDDVWNEKEELWQSLKGCLHSIGGSIGSVVLITCRKRVVADSVKNSIVRRLEGLAPEDSRALFEQTVFGNEGKCPSSLEVSAGKIVDKCAGVPLAIRTLGAALRSNKNPRHWESIANSELWNTQQFKEIAPYLLLSFRHLPSLHAQQCFAYCSIFPKGWIFPMDEMICLWMAQGLLCPEERSTLKMEEIGEIYFKLLLNHSFLQVDQVDGNGIRWYKMHDLVHDLARFVSKRDWLICGKGVGLDRGAHISHLVVGSDMTVEVSTPSFMEIMSTRLRTVRSFVELPSDRLMQSRYVRVLILYRIGLKEVPDVLGELKHLRFLDVSYNPIKELPESITTLYHLQTLHLLGCNELDKLPKGLSRLVNLRHVFANYFVEVPTGIERLTCLQTLPPIRLSASGGTSGLGELGFLLDVKGSVQVSGLEHVKSKEEAQKAGFGRKTGISYLKLRWSSLERVEGSGVMEEEVLDGLQPHPNIRSLEVDGFSGDSFPSWLRRMTVVSGNNGPSTSLDNIVVLKFQGCGRCERLPALGKLPHLKTLLINQMKAVKHIGTEFYTYDDGNDVQPCSSTSRLFPALKTLEITECPELEAWLPPKTMDPSQVAFPCLEELKIIECPFLTITPTDFPSLRGLELKQIRSAQPLHNILNTNGNNDSRSTLTSLIVYEIQELTNLPQGLSHRLTSLETLEIADCHKLDCLSDDLGRLISLKKLKIDRCPKLKTFPEIGGLCSLINLQIVSCSELEEIPSGLDRCTALQLLGIVSCPNMGLKRRLEEENTRGGGEVTNCWTGEWLGRLPHLRDCGLGGNGIGLREEEQPDRFVPDFTPLLTLKSLRYLLLRGWPKLKSLPDQLERFTRLGVLTIYKFDGIAEIPEFIGGLTSLSQLGISSCSNLKSFPSRGAMLKLKQLYFLRILGCPLLTEGCRKDDGPEWHKISLIKHIQIDDEVIQNLLEW